MSEPIRPDAVELPLTLAQHVEVVCSDFESAWQSAVTGGRPRIEHYLGQAPELERTALARELILLEVYYRRQAGEEFGPEEYQARFPALDPAWLVQAVGKSHEPRTNRGSCVWSQDSPLPELGAATERPTMPATGQAAFPRQLPTLPGYEIVGEVGHGGMGVVYRAWQINSRRLVALKMLPGGAQARSEERARFRTEAEAAARLQHPNIVPIYEVGEQAGQPFFSMEFLEGGCLAQGVGSGRWAGGSAETHCRDAQLVETLARATHYAHQRGIIHRDLTPANVLLTEDGTPKITDFGLAKLVIGGGETLTHTGSILGTPSYMAPEQATGQKGAITTATDVYGLGAILYALLTGRPPFQADTALRIVQCVVHEEPQPPRRVNPRVPRDLETICLKCLQKDSAKRYGSAEALADDLRRFVTGQPIMARRAGPMERAWRWCRRNPAVAGLLSLVALVALTGFAGIVWQWRRAENGRQEAQTALHKEEIARDAEEEQRSRAETLLHFQRIALAYREWSAYNITRADQLLDACEPARRHWEWHYVKGLCHTDLFTCTEHHSTVRCIAFSPDGRLLASAGGQWATREPGEIKIWDSATGKALHTIPSQAGPVLGLAFSPDGRRIAAACVTWGQGAPGGVKVWDVESGKETLALPPSVDNVFSVAFSPDGRALATGGSKGRLHLWDSRTGKLLHFLHQFGGSVFAVAFTVDGQWLAAGSRDGTVGLWETASGRWLKTLKVSDKVRGVRGVAFRPDSQRLAVAYWDNAVRLWDLATKQVLFTYRGHQGAVLGVAFSPDGRRVASAGNEGSVQVWSARDGAPLFTLRGQTLSVNSVAFSPDGRRLASGGSDKTVKVWNATREQEYRLVGWTSDLVMRLAFRPSGDLLAGATAWTEFPNSDTHLVRVWNLKSGQEPLTLSGHKDTVLSVAISPDGSRLASGSEDRSVQIRTLPSGKLEHAFTGHSGGVKSVAFSPDKHWLAAGTRSGTITVWDLRSRAENLRMQAHTGAIHCLAFDPTGHMLASGGDDQALKLWDAATGRLLITHNQNSGPIGDLVFSPDGLLLAWTASDDKIRLCPAQVDLAAGSSSRISSLPSLRILSGHTDVVLGLAFSPDSQRLASVGKDQTLQIWDVPSGQSALIVHADHEGLSSVGFSPDGERIVTGSDTVRLWEALELGPDSRASRLKAFDQGALDWHRGEALKAEEAREWRAAVYHLDHLISQPKLGPSITPPTVTSLAARHESRGPNEELGLLYARRAFCRAALEEWKAAAADYAQAVKLGADNPFIGYCHACVSLRLGDELEYRRICARLLERYRPTDSPENANLVAWTCVLAPGAVSDPLLPVAAAERAVAGRPGYWNHVNTLGATLYRAHRFEESIQRLKESIHLQQNDGQVEDWVFLAMACQRLGRTDEARQWLDKVERRLNETPPAASDEVSAEPVSWQRRRDWELLQREAEKLLQARGQKP